MYSRPQPRCHAQRRCRFRDRAVPAAAVSLLPLLLACAGAEEQAGSAEAPKPPAELRAAVDRATATTGDLITYEVEVERDPEVNVELPDPGVDIAGFRIVDLGQDPPETLASGRILERRWFQLRADLVGSYMLPALSAGYSDPGGDAGDLQTPEIPVEVESVLPADGTEVTDIRDIKPLRRVETGRPWLLWLGLAVAVLALALASWWWRRQRRRRADEASETPVIPPYDLAIQELQRLRRTDFSNLRELRQYYFAISVVVRAYVEGRFGLNATDLTTEEIRSRLALIRLDPDQARRLERFLVATDQVKFAAHLPLTEEIGRTYEQALGFVQATRPVEEPGEDGEEPAPDLDRTGKAA